MKDFGFPPKYRLERKSEFERAFKEGIKLVSAGIIVYFANNGFDYSRIGISVSKKFGSAVRRNRFKRRVREAFRLNRSGIPGGLDIVVLPAKEAGSVPFENLCAALAELSRAAHSKMGLSGLS